MKTDRIDQNRRHVRYVVSPRLYVAMNGASSGGILHDVSDGGLALDVVGPTPEDDRVLLDFDMSETEEHFEGVGRVIWKNDAENRVGLQFVNLPDASRHKVRNWLKAKSASRETLQNLVVQDRPDAAYFETPPWTRERASAPTAVLESPKKVDPPISTPPVSRPAPPAPYPTPPSLLATSLVKDTKSEKGRAGDTSVIRDDDNATTHLRSSFSKVLDTEPKLEPGRTPKKAPHSWKELSRWVLATAIICLVILVLAFGIRVSRTQQFNLGADFKSVESFIAKALRPSEPAPVEQPNNSTATRHPTKEPKAPSKNAVTPTTAEKPATNEKFEVMDAQHGRRYFPRTSTNLEVQFARPRPTPPASVPTAKPRLPESVVKLFSAPLSDTSAGKIGRVSQKSSGEIPVVEIIPEYPTFALQTNVQGRVVLNAIIATNGSLHDVRLTSSPSMLDATVLDAVKKWRYQPHYENGEPVEVETQIVVEFSITMQ